MNQVEGKRQRIQMFSGVISMITLLILGTIIGNNGIAYIAVGIECLFFVTTVISGSAADSLGKILRGRSARGQYRNVRRIRRNAMLWQGILGAVGTLLLAVLAEPLAANVFKVPYSSLTIAVLAPAVLLKSISAVFLGYFQGEGSELPTAATAVIRPVFLLGFAVLFCNVLKDYGAKVSNLLGKQEFTSMYGSVGVAIAVSLTEVLILLFLLLIYKGAKRRNRKQQDEGLKNVESFVDFLRVLYGNMGMSILIRLFAGLPFCLGMIFFFKSAADIDGAAESYGLFFRKYMAFFGLLIYLLCGLLISICSKTAVALKKEEHRYAKKSFQNGVHFAWASSLFCAVTAGTLAKPLSQVLNGGPSASLEGMLRFGSSLAVFVVLAFYFGKLLLLAGKTYFVLGSLGVMNILFVITGTLFLNAGNAGVLSLVYAGLISTLVLAGLLGFFAFGHLRSGINPISALLVPAGAGVVTGLICVLLVKLLTPHLGNLVTVIVGFVLSLIVFWGILLVLRNFREQELLELYKFHKKG